MKLTPEIIRSLITEELDSHSLLGEADMSEAAKSFSQVLSRYMGSLNYKEPDQLDALYNQAKQDLKNAMSIPASRRDLEETFVDKRKQGADKHFSKSQSPGEADDTWHNCMVDVKKDDKSLESAAKICTKSREQGGATLKWGEKRKKEVRAARPGGMK